MKFLLWKDGLLPQEEWETGHRLNPVLRKGRSEAHGLARLRIVFQFKLPGMQMQGGSCQVMPGVLVVAEDGCSELFGHVHAELMGAARDRFKLQKGQLLAL